MTSSSENCDAYVTSVNEASDSYPNLASAKGATVTVYNPNMSSVTVAPGGSAQLQLQSSGYYYVTGYTSYKYVASRTRYGYRASVAPTAKYSEPITVLMAKK